VSDLASLSLHELAPMLARGDCSSAEIVESVLAAIERRDGELHAYVWLNADEARSAAAEADRRRAAGEPSRSALDGLPVALKDNMSARGQPCGCASRILEGYCAPYDATVVSRLRAAGAIPLGRTNMDEFAMGSSTENSAFDATRNPWDLDRVPGGSSGGAAAAVAAGQAVAALGSDTGGSIRQPAAFCGCVGLKPTYGRVSRYGLVAFASSLDQIGPMARDVRDTARLLGAIAGRDPMDSTSLDVPVPDFESALTERLDGLRLGLPREYFGEGLDPEVDAAVRAAAGRCADLGAEIVEVALPHTPYAVAAYYLIATAEASANLARFDGVRFGRRVEGGDPIEMYLRTRAAGFGPEVKRRIILGAYALSHGYYDAYYLRAQKVRTLIRRDFEAAFMRCDALLAPVAPTPAYRLGEKTSNPLEMYLGDILTIPVNLAGICGLSVPCGFTADGLPIGLQVIGPALGEERVLRIGYAYEQSQRWFQHRPSCSKRDRSAR